MKNVYQQLKQLKLTHILYGHIVAALIIGVDGDGVNAQVFHISITVPCALRWQHILDLVPFFRYQAISFHVVQFTGIPIFRKLLFYKPGLVKKSNRKF